MIDEGKNKGKSDLETRFSMQEENQKNTKDVQFSDILASEHKELFSQFIHDYEAALERGEQAKSGNQDVQYFLSLQKNA
ncbi:hypothetical protein [Arcanobacterium hippocoleae]|uniref:hypothetical protein n=1 Tax=Arcanobacterium hippocoleae TaxID=149017 RepID=UPI003342CEA3